MLTDLQHRVWHVVGPLPDSESVALAGGGALIVLGIVDRATSDLDFFAASASQAERFIPAVEAALAADGLRVDHIQTGPGFARLQVSDDTNTITIDLSHDYRRFPTVDGEAGRVLSADELAADKLLALWGRAAPRDFRDVHALAQRFSTDEMHRLAAEKDPGFDIASLADALGVFDHRHAGEFDMDPEDHRRLRDWVHQWRYELEQHENQTCSNDGPPQGT